MNPSLEKIYAEVLTVAFKYVSYSQRCKTPSYRQTHVTLPEGGTWSEFEFFHNNAILFFGLAGELCGMEDGALDDLPRFYEIQSAVTAELARLESQPTYWTCVLSNLNTAEDETALIHTPDRTLTIKINFACKSSKRLLNQLPQFKSAQKKEPSPTQAVASSSSGCLLPMVVALSCCLLFCFLCFFAL